MATRLLLLSDTHVPARARDLPAAVWAEVEAADVVVHAGVDLLVFGHSHIPWDSTTPAGMRLLNPGSPTDRRRQPHATVMRLTLDDGAIGEPELLVVGP